MLVERHFIALDNLRVCDGLDIFEAECGPRQNTRRARATSNFCNGEISLARETLMTFHRTSAAIDHEKLAITPARFGDAVGIGNGNQTSAIMNVAAVLIFAPGLSRRFFRKAAREAACIFGALRAIA